MPIDPNTDYQPSQTRPPKPPNPDHWALYLVSVDSTYPPWMHPYNSDPGFWNYDSSAYVAGLEQWDLDSSTYFRVWWGDTINQYLINTSGLDSNAVTIANDYYDLDGNMWFSPYYGEGLDSAQWANGYDVDYDTVWNNSQATQDAMDGLNAWLAVCHLQGDPNCCIEIKPDNNSNDWKGNYDPTQGSRTFALGRTPGLGEYCSDGNSCPDSSWRNIIYNTTNSFYYQKNDNFPHPDPSFVLYPFSPFEGWFTGSTTPEGTDTMAEYAHKDFSFRQIVSHEIGHWLGLSHPDQVADGNDTCTNNVTKCHGTQLMTSGPGMPPEPGIDPIGIQPDDACEFQKLYCPESQYDGVSEQPAVPQPPSPQIFPNPTTGASKLKYQVPDREFVEIAIYDVLGSGIKAVFSGYVGAGQHAISLGTEAFPSGRYVCRVRIGESVTYLNVAVER
ncbi:MAG TPA: T9SS type A sorting domain-containing protein [Candidatus Kapabacteria bacterium]|nr:T9SS type A sorting domain-containing protein [Candidatus Kapabacteria bacterium]